MAQITKQGIPNRTTKGALGDIYTDASTGKKYKCTGAYIWNTYTEGKAEYEWRPIEEEVEVKKNTPSDIITEDKKVDQVVKPAFEEPDILPVTEEPTEEPKPERRQSKVNGKQQQRNYNKYYQKKPADK